MRTEDLTSHAINEELKKVKDFYEQKFQELIEDESIKPEIETIKQIVDRIYQIIGVANANLVSITTLNNLKNNLTTMFTNLTSYLAVPNESNLNAFNSATNNVNNYIAILATSEPRNSEDIFDRISIMKRNLTYLENKYNNLNIEVNQKNEDQNKIISDKYEEENIKIKKLDAQINDLKEVVKNQENDIEKYKTTIKTYFDEKDVNFTNLFTKMKNEKENELIKITTSFEKQYNLNYEKFKNIHKEFINDAKEKADQLDKLVNIAGQNGAKAPYVEAAENESRSSKTWRIISMAAMVIFVFVSIAIAINYNNYFETSLEWYSYLGRFFILTGIATIVAYSSKIASKHKENHRYYRQMALEFSSIFLFLSSLSDEDVNSIKKTLVEKYYANLENPNNRKDDETIDANFVKRVEKYLDILNQIKK